MPNVVNKLTTRLGSYPSFLILNSNGTVNPNTTTPAITNDYFITIIADFQADPVDSNQLLTDFQAYLDEIVNDSRGQITGLGQTTIQLVHLHLANGQTRETA